MVDESRTNHLVAQDRWYTEIRQIFAIMFACCCGNYITARGYISMLNSLVILGTVIQLDAANKASSARQLGETFHLRLWPEDVL
jgi:hypothetical protein